MGINDTRDLQTSAQASSLNKENSRLVQSTCAYCGVGCGLDIQVDNNSPQSLTGTPEHAANFGRLCVKGSHLLDTVDITGRLLEPEVYGKITNWQAATAEVAKRFSQILAKHGKESIAFYVSGQLLTEDYYVANKLMKGYIGTANIDTNSRLCMSSAVSAYKRAFGEDVVPCNYEDLEHTDLLIMVGSNAAWTHPVLFQRIERARSINPNFKLVVIDPRSTPTAQSADLHLPIAPGADAGLYCGLLHYLIENQGVDKTYIDAHTNGFEQLMDNVSPWTLDKVASFCQLDKRVLMEFFQLFAGSDRVVSFYSMGINQSSTGVDKCNAIINVHLATGKIGKLGCGPFSITGQPNAMGGREVGALANQLTCHMDIENPEHRSAVQAFWQSPDICTKQGLKAVELFDAIEQGKIKAIWIMATNPVVSLPNRRQIEKALEQCELVVVSDCVEQNDTLSFADIKLPATPWAEKDGMVTNSERCMSRQRAIMPPTGNAKPDWQIICDVARAMGFDGFEFNHNYQVFNEYAALTGVANQGRRLLDLTGMSDSSAREYNSLSPIVWPLTGDRQIKRPFANGQFSTPDNKACFISITPQLPHAKVSAEFPLLLNSGRIRDQWHTMTRTARAAKLNKHTAKPYVDIHPSDAKRFGIESEAVVSIQSQVGKVSAIARISSGVAQGQCFMPIHWSQSFSANSSVSFAYPSVVDTISGQPESKQTAVAVEPEHYDFYGEIYVKQALEMSNEKNFWFTNKLEHSHFYQIAAKGDAAEAELRLKQLCDHQKSWQWMTFSANESSQTYSVAIEAGQLKAVVYLSTALVKDISYGLDDIFAEPVLSLTTISKLLNKELQDTSKQICSCFNVSEKAIVNQIEQGAITVSELGEKLKCGTNCGSCKPELSALLEKYKIEDDMLIDVLAEAL